MNRFENVILKNHIPSVSEVNEYIQKWNGLEDYVNQEKALDKLFLKLCEDNTSIENILIKCSALNDFYSTNIFKVHNVAQHYKNMNIDERLNAKDLTLVNDLANIVINGKSFCFYSFASKYCSHHRPDVYPIYDSYVHKLLKYFRDRDSFFKFKETDLKDYVSYCSIISHFCSHYGLEQFTVKEIDKYLWQLGKEAFNRYKMKIVNYNINNCNQQKIDHLLDMNADVYIVPEMANPKQLNIPDGYRTEWVGDDDKKGLGIIWKNKVNGTIEHFISNDLNYFITFKTDKGVIVAAWPTKYGSSLKLSYPKIMMLAMEELIQNIGETPTLITGDLNCYVGQSGENKTYSIRTIDKFLGDNGFRSLYHEKAKEPLGEETECTYHHLFKEESRFFLDYAYTNIPDARFHLGEWERSISDHHPLFIEI